jgi:hypothetical protein
LKLEVLGFEIGNRESEIGKRESEIDKGGVSKLGKNCDITQKAAAVYLRVAIFPKKPAAVGLKCCRNRRKCTFRGSLKVKVAIEVSQNADFLVVTILNSCKTIACN